MNLEDSVNQYLEESGDREEPRLMTDGGRDTGDDSSSRRDVLKMAGAAGLAGIIGYGAANAGDGGSTGSGGSSDDYEDDGSSDTESGNTDQDSEEQLDIDLTGELNYDPRLDELKPGDEIELTYRSDGPVESIYAEVRNPANEHVETLNDINDSFRPENSGEYTVEIIAENEDNEEIETKTLEKYVNAYTRDDLEKKPTGELFHKQELEFLNELSDLTICYPEHENEHGHRDLGDLEADKIDSLIRNVEPEPLGGVFYGIEPVEENENLIKFDIIGKSTNNPNRETLNRTNLIRITDKFESWENRISVDQCQ